MSSPDIEIYLHDTPAKAVLEWLQQRFPHSASAKPLGKHQWQLNAQYNTQALPILIIENASIGFTSLWIDSDASPWPDDQACAREAYQFFQKEIRATPGSWKEGDDPDLWWSISATGETLIQWPG